MGEPAFLNMNFLDLFSGIGGFALAAKLAQVPIKEHYYSEIEDYPQRIYRQHFSDAVALGDVQKIDYSKLPQGRWLICGGFPCQDISVCNTNARGIGGSRSGLWWQMLRAVDALRPEYLIAENVPALTSRGLERVLFSLAQSGYDAEWEVVSARSVGAPHKRERIWIVAYPALRRCLGVKQRSSCKAPCRELAQCRKSDVETHRHSIQFDRAAAEAERTFCGQPLVNRVDDGLPHQLDRIKALGNSICPQVAANIIERLKLGTVDRACHDTTPPLNT